MSKQCFLSLNPEQAYIMGFNAAKSSFGVSSNPYAFMPAYDECFNSWLRGWYSFFGLEA